MNQIECIRCQNDQFKALSYIYLQQFHSIKQTHPQKFTIECQPYSGKQNDYKIKLTFQFTHNYPHSPPKYEIQPITGITRDNMNSIVSNIEDMLHCNRDRPVVYDIVEEIRGWIQEYLVQGKAYQEDQEKYLKKKEEVFEKPKFETFTPVTVQSFNAWKKEFDTKMKLKKIEKKQTQTKITGKQWFLGKKQEQIEQQSQQEDQQGDQQQQIEQKQQKYVHEEDDVKNNDLF